MEFILKDKLLSTLRRALSDGTTEGELLYRTLAETIGDQVGTGALPPGTRLPSERVLSRELGIARGTIRQAIDDLVARGLLERKQGSGTMVAMRIEKSLTQLSGFSEEMGKRGMVPGAIWLERAKTLPSVAEAAALAIPETAPVLRLRRLRTADGAPIAIERTVVPARFLPDPGLVGESLYAALRARDAAPMRGWQRIRADIMSEAEARLMAAAPGAPMLVIERRCVLADGTPVEFTETRYHGAFYDFSTELQA